MARFLHLADIHLGFDRYGTPERTKDFFRAFNDVIERYAIGESVDFVLIAGDLFEHRSIQPAILNQAQISLKKLQTANIPVLAIEGNHDNRPYGTATSWLKYLSDWGLLKLLDPGVLAEAEGFYQPWSDRTRRGGYIDLDCGVRVLGSSWYGAAAPQAIQQIAAAVKQLPAGPPHTVLMFHHGLENQVARYAGALRYEEIRPLKAAGVDYLALGHIHKNYSEDGWVFNPGSLEANNIEESTYQRGAYLVEINAQGIQATLKQAYYQRPITRLQIKARGQETLEEIEKMALAAVEAAVQSQQIVTEKQPIVELRIEGQVGFERLELDVRKLQNQLKQCSNALIFLLKYEADQVAYASPLSDDSDRLQVEQEVFNDLLSANSVYKKRATLLAQGLVDLKDMSLEETDEIAQYAFLQKLLNGTE
ncbi:metallophosphoesterase family protein [Almyronema epifaneia]|uniref:Nuclease SbcCD subunit D n=1 Tax=Almyronema epifaneia S1 TaxID=2991925 RepID=A0ABW6IFY3_9CYAN